MDMDCKWSRSYHNAKKVFINFVTFDKLGNALLPETIIQALLGMVKKLKWQST